MKQKELKKCCICEKGIAHHRTITFYQIKLQRFILDTKAIKQQLGLEMMLGNADLAYVMGPDKDLAIPISQEIQKIICERCMVDYYKLLQILEEENDNRTQT